MGKELIPQSDGFGVPENSGGQFIKGQMLKFIDGNYIIDKTEPLPDEPLVAIGVVTAWVRWGEDDNNNKRPLEHRVTAAGKIILMWMICPTGTIYYGRPVSMENRPIRGETRAIYI